MNQTSGGRNKDAAIIRQANRSAAVGRLMLGEIRQWSEFLEADQVDLVALPRRQLKSAKTDIKGRLSAELTKFCEKNFKGMTKQLLSEMYEEIKAHRGIEMPLLEFGCRYAPIREGVLRGNPAHLTVSLSLWGLQFKFPEDELAKDIMEAFDLGANAEEQIRPFMTSTQGVLLSNRAKIRSLSRQKKFAARSCVIACFNLLEAYLNGLAWDYLRTANTNTLSNRSKKILEDSTLVSIREKLQKYPEIISGSSLWSMDDIDIVQFLDVVKPFRDSLVHPSPFATPEKFGGYDKLRLLYRIDKATADLAISTTAKLLLKIHNHIKPKTPLPSWLGELCVKIGIADKK